MKNDSPEAGTACSVTNLFERKVALESTGGGAIPDKSSRWQQAHTNPSRHQAEFPGASVSCVLPLYFFPPIAIISAQSICHTEGGHSNERGWKHTHEPHICHVLFSTFNKQYFITISTVYHGNDFFYLKDNQTEAQTGSICS